MGACMYFPPETFSLRSGICFLEETGRRSPQKTWWGEALGLSPTGDSQQASSPATPSAPPVGLR